MKKDKKEELKKLFSIIDEKKFLRFAKSYACKNEDFADAIVAFFLPENKPIDYKKSIAECFAHKKKGRVASWKLHFDWAVIRREARRVMKQLQMIADGGDYAAAIDGALLFLETLCKYFKDDNFEYDYNTYEGKDFSNNAALSIVRRLLLSEHSELSNPEKLHIIERLKNIGKKGVIDEYLEGNLGRLIDDAQEGLLDDGQMLVELDEKIAAAKHDHCKARFIIRKAQLLNGMNRREDAELLIGQNMHIEEIRKYCLDTLIAEGKYDEANSKCDAFLKEKNHRTQEWMEYKLTIAGKTDNRQLMCHALQWLCVNANADKETRKGYCTRLKSICEEKQWLQIREALVRDLVEDTYKKELGFWLLKQEGLYERLYDHISALPHRRNYFGSMQSGEMLRFYSLFFDVFTSGQQESLETRICDYILSDAALSKKDKDYIGIQYEIEQLAKVRPESHAKAVALRDNLIRLYPRKPLFLSILKDAEL